MFIANNLHSSTLEVTELLDLLSSQWIEGHLPIYHLIGDISIDKSNI